jgi:hypothetical protein
LAFGAMLGLAACAAKTTGTTGVTDGTATVHATARCDKGETCKWYWEYWPAGGPRSVSRKTTVSGPVSGPTSDIPLSTTLTGLQPNTAYRWVFCGSPNNGGAYACAGPNGTFGPTTADPPPDYETFTTPPRTTLAQRWNGRAWTLQTTPNPTGATDNNLAGVSCASPTACTAVGNYTSGGVTRALAERWDGAAWAIQTTPTPTGATSSVLSGGSCTSPTACTAVGRYTSAGVTHTLAERWDGTNWTIQPTPDPTGGSPLTGVSCTSATACTAVGGSGTTLAERWDGTAWTIQTTPTLTGGVFTVLTGVSCASATSCTAVGYRLGPRPDQTPQPLAERWDGTTWTIQAAASASSYDTLSGVSCTSPTACTAVGDSQAVSLPLAERWDGTAWTIQTTPTPPNDLGTLSGVSCASATRCTAVGRSVNATTLADDGTLAEAWDGTSWTIQPTPKATGGLPQLFGASCTGLTACTAVGSQ